MKSLFCAFIATLTLSLPSFAEPIDPTFIASVGTVTSLICTDGSDVNAGLNSWTVGEGIMMLDVLLLGMQSSTFNYAGNKKGGTDFTLGLPHNFKNLQLCKTGEFIMKATFSMSLKEFKTNLGE